MNLAATYHDRELRICLSGEIVAETLLENLASHLPLARENSQLCLDLSGVESFDELAHTALVVVLRSRCDRFQRVTLSGLLCQKSGLSWVAARHDLLGPGWKGEISAEVISFTRLPRGETAIS